LSFAPSLKRPPQKENDVPATIREAGPDDTEENLEAERAAAQEAIDNGACFDHVDAPRLMASSAEPLAEAEREEKEDLIAEGFEDWSRRDFQQFVRALETYGW
jgi:SWI/SNF-related matrix-associated actin-dependent regulator of chromatin subfamily A member 5